ncbi:MAG: hypothetical protein N0E48_24985 [Candidatus Thiodiazotropha endolucinida]|nr:hypothetical protein [Candidatus Thiodiazotropha endolucinida]
MLTDIKINHKRRENIQRRQNETSEWHTPLRWTRCCMWTEWQNAEKTAKAVYSSKTTQTGQNGTDTECQTTSRPGMQLPVTGSLEDDASAEPRRFVPAGSEQCMYDVD